LRVGCPGSLALMPGQRIGRELEPVGDDLRQLMDVVVGDGVAGGRSAVESARQRGRNWVAVRRPAIAR
jgi:hypothetical protein